MASGCRDPQCSYRALYEGSQLSLSEMAGRQAEAFNRLNDLRTAVVIQLKRTFPRLFASAEAQGGQRMSAVSDQVLVAYLEAFLATVQVRSPRPEGIEDLRAALNRRGIPIPSDLDVSQWAQLLDRGVQAPRRSIGRPALAAAPPSPDIRDRTAPAPAGFDTVVTPVSHATAPVVSPALDDRDYDDGDPDWESYNDYEPTIDVASTPTEVDDTDELRQMFSEDSPTVAPPRSDAVPAPAVRPPLRPEPPYVAPSSMEHPRPPARTSRQTTVKTPRTKRATRAKAAPPNPLVFDVPAETPVLDPHGELTDSTRSALAAAVCIPRPVFVADLETITGSRDLAEAWERERWEDPQSSVGFISAKPRHHQRGSLVVPVEYAKHPAPEFARSVWAACLARLSGARLYEVAVLLHRVGNEVTNWRFAANNRVLVLTVAQRRGLVGLIVTLEQHRDLLTPVLESEFEELLTQRPVLVTVLVTHDPSYDVVRSIVLESAETRRWQPAFPVTMVRSWDYGSPSTPVDLILGN